MANKAERLVEGEGFMIIVGRADAKSDPEELVIIDGSQYEVFDVNNDLSELGQPDGEWVFDLDQEDALTARLAELRIPGNSDLKQRIKELGVKGLAVAAGKGGHNAN